MDISKSYNQISGNQILASLNHEELEIVSPHLKLIPINIGEELADAGEKMKYVYFPVSGIISFIYTLEDGSTAEIGLLGREGFCGIPVLFGGETMPYDAVVQGKGEAYRMPVSKLIEIFNSSPIFHNTLLLFCQSFISQISQTAVCNRHHSIEKQLCRWLLLLLDRSDDNQLNMTQEVIAIMLGVRREGVSMAAMGLRDEGIIKYHRGLIQILNRSKLEKVSCECYRVVKSENDRLFKIANTLKNKTDNLDNKLLHFKQ